MRFRPPSKNKLKLYRAKNSVVASKDKQRITNLQAGCRLFANLFIACQARDGDLDNFFAHENHAYPVALSEYGKLRKCPNKSDVLQCFNDIVQPSLSPPEVDIRIVDAAGYVNINKPVNSSTFGEYCAEEIPLKIRQHLSGLKRIDFVFDTYKDDSIKGQTREAPVDGVRIAVRKETPLVTKFQSFLRNNENKTELFKLLAVNIANIPSSSVEILATYLEDVLSNNPNVDVSAIQPCNHEEADTRLLLHALHASNNGFQKLLIVTVDTDVVILAIHHFFSLGLEELWVEIGVGSKRRWLPIHQYAKSLSRSICHALAF